MHPSGAHGVSTASTNTRLTLLNTLAINKRLPNFANDERGMRWLAERFNG